MAARTSSRSITSLWSASYLLPNLPRTALVTVMVTLVVAVEPNMFLAVTSTV